MSTTFICYGVPVYRRAVETFVTKYNEDTGVPYKKMVCDYGLSLRTSGKNPLDLPDEVHDELTNYGYLSWDDDHGYLGIPIAELEEGGDTLVNLKIDEDALKNEFFEKVFPALSHNNRAYAQTKVRLFSIVLSL